MGLGHESERRFRAFAESANDAMITAGSNGGIVSWNRAAERMFGYAASEVLGRPLSILTPERFRARHDAGLRRVAEGGASSLIGRTAELSARRADGTEFPIELSLFTWEGDEGRFFGGIIRDIGDRKQAHALEYERRLRHLADHDGLTGLVNRRRFEESIGGDGALILIGLDRFKFVNDAHGHTAGDAILRTVAAELRAATRPGDIVARLGGDEFGVLLDRASLADAAERAEELVGAIAGCRPPAGGLAIAASAGVVRLGDANRPLVAAHLAMHAAKEAGGNRVHVTHGADRRVAGMYARVSRADEVRRALDENRLTLHWQPIVELATGAVTQHELLLRMIGTDGALVAPAGFIEIAERFGLIDEIDRWVIRRAIWLLAERPAARLEVNLSGSTLGDAGLPDLVERELALLGVDPGRLVFEITETSAIADLAQACELAERLTRLGCRFALDDFGAGFSSFRYLKHLPLDYVKIDGEFIRGLAGSPTDRLVVKAMVDIARGMAMKTIAEFVEDAETAELLRELGVDYAQGYHHGRPVPIGSAEAAQQLAQQAGKAFLLDA